MTSLPDNEKKADEPIGFLTRFPEKFHPIFLRSLDLKTRNLLRLVSRKDREIVDSVKVEVAAVTFFNEGTVMTARMENETECFLNMKEYEPKRIAYFLKICDVKEFRVMKSTAPSLSEVDDLVEWNSAYVQNFYCEENDENAILLLRKCIAGQLKNINMHMCWPPKSIAPLFYVPGVTSARKFHMIHHKDAPVLHYVFIKRWVYHADLEESVGRRIVSEGHSHSSIVKFVNSVNDGFERHLIALDISIPNGFLLIPNDSRYRILIIETIVGENNRRVTSVVIPKETKVGECEDYAIIADDYEAKEKEKEKENDENEAGGIDIQTGGIDIEKNDVSISFEKNCSFIDPAELPASLK